MDLKNKKINVLINTNLNTCQYPRQPFILKGKNHIFVYYEDIDKNNKWRISVSRILQSQFPYGKWENFEGILSKSNIKEDPSNEGIGDPTIIYYNKKYHMWFDMLNSKLSWTLGYAVSDDGINWKKAMENNRTKMVLTKNKLGNWDDKFVHAPEVFIYKGKIRIIYNAISTKNNRYSAGIAKLSNPNELNSKLIRIKRISYPELLPTKQASRFFAPFIYKDKLYSVLSSAKIPNNPTRFYYVYSNNDGLSWRVLKLINNNLHLHSFLLHNKSLYAVSHNKRHIYKIEGDIL